VNHFVVKDKIRLRVQPRDIAVIVAIRNCNWLGAGMSVVSMVPYLGDAIAKPAKGCGQSSGPTNCARPSPNLAPS